MERKPPRKKKSEIEKTYQIQVKGADEISSHSSSNSSDSSGSMESNKVDNFEQLKKDKEKFKIFENLVARSKTGSRSKK